MSKTDHHKIDQWLTRMFGSAFSVPPRWLDDLDACHGAERILRFEFGIFDEYVGALVDLINETCTLRFGDDIQPFVPPRDLIRDLCIFAKASHRCEAMYSIRELIEEAAGE